MHNKSADLFRVGEINRNLIVSLTLNVVLLIFKDRVNIIHVYSVTEFDDVSSSWGICLASRRVICKTNYIGMLNFDISGESSTLRAFKVSWRLFLERVYIIENGKLIMYTCTICRYL